MNDIKSLKIFLATDHAGFAAKEAVREWLLEEGYNVSDCGAYEHNPEDDYPAFIIKAAKAVAVDTGALGIIFGGSGQGEAMMANRVKGVRAVVYYGHEQSIVTLSREHNGANVLSFGARFITIEEMKEMILLWLKTPTFSEDKHQRRAKQIDELG